MPDSIIQITPADLRNAVRLSARRGFNRCPVECALRRTFPGMSAYVASGYAYTILDGIERIYDFGDRVSDWVALWETGATGRELLAATGTLYSENPGPVLDWIDCEWPS